MTITVPLPSQDEAKLIALAQAKGVSTGELIHEALDHLLATAKAENTKEPTRSLRGLLAKHGSAPSAQDIDESRAEMLGGFSRSDF